MILFGPAGVPLSCKTRNSEDGVREVGRLGLDLMEVEFVRGVHMSAMSAAGLGAVAVENNIALTAHGPYYINLASDEADKAEASVKRILDTARRCHQFGGRSITFHAAFFQKQDPEQVFAIVRDQLAAILKTLRAEGVTVAVAPEVTGKPSQFAGIDELTRLAQAVPGLSVCIDFSHHAARLAGAENNYDGFCRALKLVRDRLGPAALGNLHMHASGIEWTDKGEKKHLRLEESKFQWREMIRALVDFEAGGMMVCESPAMEDDALVLKTEYQRRVKGKKK
jgi:deoxyribonuclease IV